MERATRPKSAGSSLPLGTKAQCTAEDNRGQRQESERLSREGGLGGGVHEKAGRAKHVSCVRCEEMGKAYLGIGMAEGVGQSDQ